MKTFGHIIDYQIEWETYIILKNIKNDKFKS